MQGYLGWVFYIHVYAFEVCLLILKTVSTVMLTLLIHRCSKRSTPFPAGHPTAYSSETSRRRCVTLSRSLMTWSVFPNIVLKTWCVASLAWWNLKQKKIDYCRFPPVTRKWGRSWLKKWLPTSVDRAALEIGFCSDLGLLADFVGKLHAAVLLQHLNRVQYGQETTLVSAIVHHAGLINLNLRAF